MNVYTLIIMDGTYPVVTVSSDWRDLKCAALDYDAYGVGGCSCCPGGRYGRPVWHASEDQSEDLETAPSFEAFKIALNDILHNDENEDVVVLLEVHAVLAPHH